MRPSPELLRLLVRFGWCAAVALMVAPYALMVIHPPQGLGFDLHVFWKAARAVGHGNSPYDAAGVAHQRVTAALHPHVQPIAPWAVYPPAIFVALVPLGWLPWHVAFVLGVAFVAAAAALALHVLGVRDWRCYVLAFASVPVVSSVALGAISTALMLGFAVLWKGRATIGVGAATVVAKLFLWPVAFAVAGISGVRRGALLALTSCAVALGSWALIGFADITAYPRIVSDLSAIEAHNSFSTTGLAFGLGLSPALGTAFGLIAGATAIGFCVREGRSGRRESAFALALLASFLLSPIVWEHYLVLLFVPLAARHPHLDRMWLVPLVLWMHPEQAATGNVFAIACVWACVATVIIPAVRSGWVPDPRLATPAPTRPVHVPA